MYRKLIEELYKWKDKKNRKPLIIEGARQVGKTWLMKEFGDKAYSDYIYINFDSNSVMADLFSTDLNIERIIMGIEIYAGKKVNSATTLLIFDEIQEVPKALASLKYFCENAPEYHIICAGSLLGIALHSGTSFPVGKVDFLNLYPLTFKEFLIAVKGEHFAKLLETSDYTMITSFKETYIEALKQYYFVGGMPEAVQNFIEEKDFNEVRNIQKRILSAYEQDFSKHAPNDMVPKIRMIWNSIPSQLAKENKKFIYGLVREGGRAKDFETAIMLFIVDIGLLGCITGLSSQTILYKNELFTEFKGAITEQYVCQQLKSVSDLGLYYYTNDRGSCEIDFVVDTGEQVIPLEVKAEINLKAKSLKTYREKYNPKLSIRMSVADFKAEDGLINLPLYMAEEFFHMSKLPILS